MVMLTKEEEYSQGVDQMVPLHTGQAGDMTDDDSGKDSYEVQVRWSQFLHACEKCNTARHVLCSLCFKNFHTVPDLGSK